MMRPRVLTIQHQADGPPGLLGRWLTEAGLQPVVVRPDLGEPLPASVRACDGLVVLGGSMGANDDAEAPWLPPTRKLLEQAAGDGVPTLGVCLGHQLLAVACGGRVEQNPAGRRQGLVDLEPTAEAAEDPLFAELPRPAPAFRWNQDIVVETPPRSVVLATADGGVTQAFRVGTNAWGVQVHPEVTVDIARRWAARSPDDPAAAAALRALESAAPRLAEVWWPFARAFARRVHAASGLGRGG